MSEAVDRIDEFQRTLGSRDPLELARLQHSMRLKRAIDRFVREHGNPLIDEGYKVSDLFLRYHADRVELGVNGQPPIATLYNRDCFDS